MSKASVVPPLVERQKPGLSDTLTFEKSPVVCQGCGEFGGLDLLRWRECDEFDRPGMTVVVLCGICSNREIDRHPRLYVPLARREPFPGVMEICVECRLRDGVTCTSPLAKHNGGAGMEITGPKPTAAHLNYGGGRGEFIRLYSGEPSACAGRSER